MAGKKLPYSELSRSAKFYRDNPEARKKKQKTDAEVNRRPEQRKKRSELTTERRKRGIAGRGGGDLSHEGGKLVRRSVSANRGHKSNSAGDRNARGSKK
jgi:MoxR-like ATPase